MFPATKTRESPQNVAGVRTLMLRKAGSGSQDSAPSELRNNPDAPMKASDYQALSFEPAYKNQSDDTLTKMPTVNLM